MVVGVFPALKLGVLFIKQISKPLAKMFVSQAKSHPVFRTYFIIPPAQFYHWAEVKAKMYIMNLGKPAKVAKLNEAMAIELGANLLGEIIIFSVAGSCLILEYNRQVAKESKKEEARQAQLQKFTEDIESLHKTTSHQETEIQQLQNLLDELVKHTKCKISVNSKLDGGTYGTMIQKIDNSVKSDEKTQHEENENQSLVHRAVLYYENDVRGNRLRAN